MSRGVFSSVDLRPVGWTTGPKGECEGDQVLDFTELRVYFLPFQSHGTTIFDTYNWDFVNPGGNIDYECAVYEQVGDIEGSGVLMRQVTASSTGGTNVAGNFTTTAIGSTVALDQGSYWCAFIFQSTEIGSPARLTSQSQIIGGTWVLGSWLYYDSVAFGLSPTYQGTTGGSNPVNYIFPIRDYPFWAAGVYTGDALP